MEDANEMTEGQPSPEAQAPEAAEEKQESTEKVDFAPPPNFTIPESASETGEFDAVCTFKVEGDKLCLVKLGDTPMPGYSSESPAKTEQKPTYDKLVAGAQEGAPSY